MLVCLSITSIYEQTYKAHHNKITQEKKNEAGNLDANPEGNVRMPITTS